MFGSLPFRGSPGQKVRDMAESSGRTYPGLENELEGAASLGSLEEIIEGGGDELPRDIYDRVNHG